MSPGDLHWVEFPPTDGHEQANRRPAIVLQDDKYAGAVSMVFIVPVTGQPANARFPATVLLDPSPTNGLRLQSVALVYQARAMDRRRVERRRIGVLSPAELDRVYEALDRLTGRTRPSVPAPAPPPPNPSA